MSSDELGGDTATDQARADHLTRRRFENEVFMLQSDRSRLERQSDELEASIRTLEKSVSERVRELEEYKTDRNHLMKKIQDIDAEIIRVKRASYKK